MRMRPPPPGRSRQTNCLNGNDRENVLVVDTFLILVHYNLL